jgi:hypothetical protein
VRVTSGAGVFALTITISLLLVHHAVHAQTPGRRDVLRQVGAYLDGYEQAFSNIVCDEYYTQRARVENGWQTRQLRSEVALIRTKGDDWRLFRDVLSVDGIRVRDRDERLARLFADPGRNASGEATRITEESARYNIGGVDRTLNVPTLALIFLRKDNQDRSSFTIASRGRQMARDVVDLRFGEKRNSRIIYTSDRAPASGRVWVDTADGTVHGTELRILTEGTLANIYVTYKHDDKLDLLVPEVMTETYRTGARRADTGIRSFDQVGKGLGVVLEGSAIYSSCRRFSVTARIR